MFALAGCGTSPKVGTDYHVTVDGTSGDIAPKLSFETAKKPDEVCKNLFNETDAVKVLGGSWKKTTSLTNGGAHSSVHVCGYGVARGASVSSSGEGSLLTVSVGLGAFQNHSDAKKDFDENGVVNTFVKSVPNLGDEAAFFEDADKGFYQLGILKGNSVILINYSYLSFDASGFTKGLPDSVHPQEDLLKISEVVMGRL